MTRKHAVTVRLPVASIAPTNKTVACSHTGLENSGANSTIRGNNSAGNVSIEGPLVAKVVSSLCCPPLLLQRAKMAKVEHRCGPLPSFDRLVACTCCRNAGHEE